MIDFIRVYYSDKDKFEKFILNQNYFQEAFSAYEMHSKKVLYPYKTHLENMELVTNEKNGYVKNSIHKLNNLLLEGDEHNHNDFTYSQLSSIIDYLGSNIIDVTNQKLTQLEFGLNISIPITAKEVISKSVLMHNFKRHSTLNEFKGNGYLMAFEHYNYIIKIYDKAKQYNIKDQNILRFEIKFLSPKEFNKLGVYSLNDLKDKNVLNSLFKHLLKRFDELLIVDNYSEDSIPKEDYEKLNMYSSYTFWEKLSKENKRQLKLKQKEKYYSLLKKHSLLKTTNELKDKLTIKFNQLLSN